MEGEEDGTKATIAAKERGKSASTRTAAGCWRIGTSVSGTVTSGTSPSLCQNLRF